MKTLCIWGILPIILVLGACGDSDLLEDYFVDTPRILAVKIQDPEAQPGDSIAMKMLVGGRTISQQMTATVFWAIDDAEPELIDEAAYTQSVDYQIPIDALAAAQWFDLPIYARIQLEQKGLNAQKLVRITGNPTAKNPVISGVRLQYLREGQLDPQMIANGDTISIPADVSNVALTAQTEALPPGQNDKLVYRWYISLAADSAGILYIQREKKEIEALLGAGAKASERRRSAVFSLRGKDNDKNVQIGTYNLYLVVRDNATNPQSLADERYGTDFIYATLRVGGGS